MYHMGFAFGVVWFAGFFFRGFLDVLFKSVQYRTRCTRLHDYFQFQPLLYFRGEFGSREWLRAVFLWHFVLAFRSTSYGFPRPRCTTRREVRELSFQCIWSIRGAIRLHECQNQEGIVYLTGKERIYSPFSNKFVGSLRCFFIVIVSIQKCIGSQVEFMAAVFHVSFSIMRVVEAALTQSSGNFDVLINKAVVDEHEFYVHVDSCPFFGVLLGPTDFWIVFLKIRQIYPTSARSFERGKKEKRKKKKEKKKFKKKFQKKKKCNHFQVKYGFQIWYDFQDRNDFHYPNIFLDRFASSGTPFRTGTSFTNYNCRI
ncbi:hypothetical protein EYC84_003578 [Monilinia fructicola]|uniref:Uncharacterized protein n=1 Tax=Monilinia fructicola TaxID=38448 RepID=A0A5M9JWM3_MONFR|nr:hypothetical protein EYC84_003578 [Monilinia fructicola]